MKFPSLFKATNYSRFHYEPRYYDPIKEEIKAKMEAAKSGVEHSTSTREFSSNISAAFSRRAKKSGQSSIVQLIIVVALFGTFVGWIFFGNDIFYIYLILSPLYFYFRIKGTSSPKQ